MKEHILTYLPKGHPWAEHIHYYPITDSTNVQAKRLAEQGAPEGTVCIAGQQTGGKGRMGRSFHSPENKGLYFSVVLRPNCPATDLMHLTCAVATYACNAVEKIAGNRPQVKWINDLVFDRKKLGGILTELSVDPNTGLVRYAIIGIGINCLQEAGDFPAPINDVATSIFACCQKAITPAQLSASLIKEMQLLSSQLIASKTAIMAQYKKDCMTLNQQIRIVRAEEERYATALDIDPDGGLIAELTDGSVITVSSGEVSVRGMYGYL